MTYKLPQGGQGGSLTYEVTGVCKGGSAPYEIPGLQGAAAPCEQYDNKAYCSMKTTEKYCSCASDNTTDLHKLDVCLNTVSHFAMPFRIKMTIYAVALVYLQ